MKQKLNNHEENKQETHIQNLINLEKNKLFRNIKIYLEFTSLQNSMNFLDI